MSEAAGRGVYLLRLTARLADGLARVPADARGRHAAFLPSVQNDDGGFSGREGGSDLYYTAFGLRGLLVLGELSPAIARRAAEFLRTSLTREASVIDFFSLLYAALLVRLGGGPDVLGETSLDWRERVATILETFRTPEGGYARLAGNPGGSTYHTFLVALTYELLDRPLPRPEEVVRFIRSRRREDGGFVEAAPMRRSGTNPTAAAVGVLQVLQQTAPDCGLTDEERAAAVNLLASMPSPEGGLRANGRAPLADLLSTFTGLWTLDQLNALDRVDRAAVLAYGRSLELPGGGFRGGLWDDRADVEYTFYGLGVLGLLGY